MSTKVKLSDEKPHSPHIGIVGAGIAGIATAIRLKAQYNFQNFTIYEKSDAIGGTWRDNTYLGCGSDVPAHWYSLSTDLNPNWETYYVDQPQLRAYWENLWHKYDLVKHTKLHTFVKSSAWDVPLQRYRVTLEDSQTGKQSTTEAEILFYAIGGFQGPLYPKDISGIDTFHGDLFHSARWRHDVPLAGKRVGVIGNGCSAAQFIPKIAEDPSVELINFCRTPQWYVPRNNYGYPRWLRWVFGNIPFIMRFYRNFIMARSDITFPIFQVVYYLPRKPQFFTAYIKSKVPKDQLANLIPKYSPGCKRIILDPGYLDALNKPNVHIEWEAIDSVVEEGIKLKTGKVIPLDVIIFGTGYSVAPDDLVVTGSKGGTINEYFASKGGPTGYVGTCMPGFPNLFTLLGPNVATGHASVIFSQEAQISFAMQLVKPVIDGQASSFEVTEKATDEYNEWLQGRLSTSVWKDCNSYYQVGGNSKTKLTATFPGPVTLFWWITRAPDWEKFSGVGAEGWEKQRKVDGGKRIRNIVAGMLIIIGVMISSKINK